MGNINIHLEEKLHKDLKHRAEKNYQKIEELASDIIRRSMVSYKKNIANPADKKVDDALISIFSRQNKGRRK
jgi:hypothetical protein